MEFKIVLDRNEDGSLKRIKGGFFRFELRLKEGEDTKVGIAGFRYDDEYDRIFPPAGGRFTTISLVYVCEEMTIRIKEKLKAAIAEEKNINYS